MDGEALSFGVSGRLYRSNVPMYDQQTNGLWSQLKEEAVTGERTGLDCRPYRRRRRPGLTGAHAIRRHSFSPLIRGIDGTTRVIRIGAIIRHRR